VLFLNFDVLLFRNEDDLVNTVQIGDMVEIIGLIRRNLPGLDGMQCYDYELVSNPPQSHYQDGLVSTDRRFTDTWRYDRGIHVEVGISYFHSSDVIVHNAK
jgi:hypothetical protein